MCTAFACGKLMIAGEWAVLELGNPCIVMGIDKGVAVTVRSSKSMIINCCDLFFVQPAIDIATTYLREHDKKIVPFYLSIKSDISEISLSDGFVVKPGFGSSAAVVVAVVKGVLKFHGCRVDKQTIFKLASVAHYMAQGFVGSCFDIAASTYGGVLVYTRFDPDWLQRQLEKSSLSEVVEASWPYFSVRSITLPAVSAYL